MKEIKRLTRCEKGHFFDAGRYETCPHCLNTREIPQTQLNRQSVTGGAPVPAAPSRPVTSSGMSTDQPRSIRYAPSETTVQRAQFPMPSAQDEPTTTTVHFYQKALGSEPVVGWLVCVEGVHYGQDFRIKSGRNFIGRSGNMDVCLSGDMAVSRDKHAILTYDPKGNTFFMQPGETSELSYLNGNPLLEATAVKSGDRLTVGETELIFVPFCGKTFKWKKEDRA